MSIQNSRICKFLQDHKNSLYGMSYSRATQTSRYIDYIGYMHASALFIQSQKMECTSNMNIEDRSRQ